MRHCNTHGVVPPDRYVAAIVLPIFSPAFHGCVDRGADPRQEYQSLPQHPVITCLDALTKAIRSTYSYEAAISFYTIPKKKRIPRISDDAVEFRWRKKLDSYVPLDWPESVGLEMPIVTGMALDYDLYDQPPSIYDSDEERLAKKRPWRSVDEFKEQVGVLRDMIPEMECAGFWQSRHGLKAFWIFSQPVPAIHGDSLVTQFWNTINCYARRPQDRPKLKVHLDPGAQSWNECWRLPNIVRADGPVLRGMKTVLRHLRPLTWTPPRPLVEAYDERQRQYTARTIYARERKRELELHPVDTATMLGQIEAHLVKAGQARRGGRNLMLYRLVQDVVGGYGLQDQDEALRVLTVWDRQNPEPLENEQPTALEKMIEKAVDKYTGEPPWLLRPPRPKGLAPLTVADLIKVNHKVRFHSLVVHQSRIPADAWKFVVIDLRKKLRLRDASAIYRYMSPTSAAYSEAELDEMWGICVWAAGVQS